MIDLSQVRVEGDRGTVALENFIVAGAFAKQNFSLSCRQSQFCFGFNGEAVCYASNDGVGCAAAFRFDGGVQSAFHEYSTETLTIYEVRRRHAAAGSRSARGQSGRRVLFLWPLYASPGGPVTSEVLSSKTLVNSRARPIPTSKSARRSCVSSLAVEKIRLSLLARVTTRRRLPNFSRINRLCGQYWAGPGNTSVRGAS